MKNFLTNKLNSNPLESYERDNIIDSILKTRRDLDIIMKNYEIADSDLTDYYLYQIKATQAKLDYLIKQAKSQKIKLDSINNYKLVINF